MISKSRRYNYETKNWQLTQAEEISFTVEFLKLLYALTGTYYLVKTMWNIYHAIIDYASKLSTLVDKWLILVMITIQKEVNKSQMN